MNKSKTNSSHFLQKYSLTDVELGAGAYSEVFVAIRKSDDLKVAVKVVKVTNAFDLSSLRNEVKIMQTLAPHQVLRCLNSKFFCIHLTFSCFVCSMSFNYSTTSKIKTRTTW